MERLVSCRGPVVIPFGCVYSAVRARAGVLLTAYGVHLGHPSMQPRLLVNTTHSRLLLSMKKSSTIPLTTFIFMLRESSNTP